MPHKGPFAESFRSRCSAALRRFFLRFSSPDKHRAVMVLRQASSILSGFPASASRDRLNRAEARVHTMVQAALSGKSRLSRVSPLRHAEEVFTSSRRLTEAAAAVRRERGRLWPLINGTVCSAAAGIRALERHLHSGRGDRDASRERLREDLELARRQLVSARLHAHSVSGTDACRHDLLAMFQRAEELVETLENRPRRS